MREFWSLPFFVSPATLNCRILGNVWRLSAARLPEQPCRILDLGQAGHCACCGAAPGLRNYRFQPNHATDALSFNASRSIWRQKYPHYKATGFSASRAKQFAMIVSNPPYIERTLMSSNERDVARAAHFRWLRGGGMAVSMHIIEQSRNTGARQLASGRQQGGRCVNRPLSRGELSASKPAVIW